MPDIQTLSRALEHFFPPHKFKDIDESTLVRAPKVTRMFLALNVEAPEWESEVKDSAICYLNSWGELFFQGFDSDRGVHLARNFVREAFAYDLIGARSNFLVHLPRRAYTSRIGQKLNQFFGFKVFEN